MSCASKCYECGQEHYPFRGNGLPDHYLPADANGLPFEAPECACGHRAFYSDLPIRAWFCDSRNPPITIHRVYAKRPEFPERCVYVVTGGARAGQCYRLRGRGVFEEWRYQHSLIVNELLPAPPKVMAQRWRR